MKRLVAALALSAVSSLASASLLTSFSSLSAPNTTISDFGLHSTNVGNGYSATLTGNVQMNYVGNSGLYFDYQGWGLGSNGSAFGNFVGINQGGSLTFKFLNGPVRGAGILMNYAPGFGPVRISALDAVGGVLETYQIDAVAPITSNTDVFRGIQMSSASIYSFQFSADTNASPLARNLSFTTAVPEPETYAMLLAGLGLMGAIARRKKPAA